MQRARETASHKVRKPSILPISARGLVVERSGRRVVDGVDIDIAAGSGTLVILGPNGAGKSLLLRTVAGLLEPDQGSVTWDGTPPDRARSSRLGFVFQKPVLLRRSALANVVYALAAAGIPRSEQPSRAARALASAGLEALAHTPARVLSGGEQQRLTLARALAMEPEALLLDEPTSSLDPASTDAIEGLIRTARAQGTVVVLVTHDLGQARRLADEVAFLHRGRLIERAPAARFFDAPATPQARAFLAGEIVL